MEPPAAKQGDKVIGLDTHVVLVPSPGGPVPTVLPMPFSGSLSEALSSTVFVDDAPAATVGSRAHNLPPHIPMGGPFQRPPANQATVQQGSATVFAGDQALARAGDPATCCNDPRDAETGHVVAAGTVFAGG
jgi:uncharacterized Zn-binding protein involved in type VI secretion